MGLVDYSDSESDSDSTPKPTTTAAPKQKTTSSSSTTFQPLVDRSNPRRIQISLPEAATDAADGSAQDADGPARKRPRIGGGGAFSGFNSFLPAPKRAGAVGKTSTENGDSKDNTTVPARKVFSLKTGAGPGFDRRADAEMVKEQHDESWRNDSQEDGLSTTLPPPKTASTPTTQIQADEPPKTVGNPMMFRPLSVARNTKKKPKKSLPPPGAPSAISNGVVSGGSSAAAKTALMAPSAPPSQPPKPKVSLFSLGGDDAPSATASSSTRADTETEYTPMLHTSPETNPPESSSYLQPSEPPTSTPSSNPQSLTSIASELNLTKAQQRQLFGRNHDASSFSAASVRNFNTDAEYASNEALRASGETVQHNPLKAIAPGKHSLKQLVSAAQTQKDALEEHWAQGKGKKKEAGSRYGW